ncbi:hypothetical protein AVEN_62463-1 [Araneus ventricosus]|uniref:Uncharacterized protein n=1 Tax=Araneus ventricosus TaxID=182803 RepID=A0A4Y2NPX1_ARAVE|nr:hypothetical protein AVEN_62463-1 [Araneus ventricosus]
MDEETPITEITDIATDAASIFAKLRRQSNLIKVLTKNTANASRLETDLMHDPALHAGINHHMTCWQKELNSLESEFLTKHLTPTQSSQTPKNKKNEKPFEFPPKRLTAKLIPQLENNKANPFVDNNKFQNLETDQDDGQDMAKASAMPYTLRT